MGSKNIRQLAAVLFTDIAGYTAMMQENEHRANQQRDKHRQILEERSEEFYGKVLHYFGDGALTIFNSTRNAVKCGIQVQKDLQSSRVPVRMGIHEGDIVYNEEEVFGNAVNIASRLESLSAIGGIMISEKVKEEIQNHPEIKTKSLGSYTLKNVKQPLAISAISNKGIAIPSLRDVEEKMGRLSNKIAVLPFVNMSDEGEFDNFTDGLTEEIINGLAQMGTLDVISRTSVFAYKGMNEDIRKIGRELSVSHVLEGSVRKYKDRVRVTAQLIETDQGFHLWSETFDRELKDPFEIQDAISSEILSKFKSDLQKNSANTADSSNAHNLLKVYLEGTFYEKHFTIPDVRKAISCFKQVIEEDPKFEAAYVELAFCNCYLGVAGQGTAQHTFQKAQKYLAKAQSLDQNNSIHAAVRGLIETFFHYNLSEANRSFAKSLSPDEYNGKIYYSYAAFLNIIGQTDLAIRCLELAIRCEPASLIYNVGLARTFYYAGKYTQALQQFDYTLELDASFLPAINGKGWTYVAMGDDEKAHDTFEIYQNLVSQEQENIPQLVYMAAKKGMNEVASHFLDLLQLGGDSDHYVVTPLDVALVYLGLGKRDEAFFHLQRAIDDKVGKMLFIDTDPIWDELKSDPRFNDLKKQLGLNSSVSPLVEPDFDAFSFPQ